MDLNAPVALNTRITLSIVVLAVPLFVWAGRLDDRVEHLERERVELKADLKRIEDKLDDVRTRIPLVRPKVEYDGAQPRKYLRGMMMPL